MRLALLILLALAARARAEPPVARGTALAWNDAGDATGVAVTDDGLWLAGTFTHALHPDPAAPATLAGDAQDRPFLLAFDRGRHLRWARAWDPAAMESVAATTDGPIVLCTFRSVQFDADPGPRTALVRGLPGADTTVVIALTGEGALRWTWSEAGVRLHPIAALGRGAVIVGGRAHDGAGFVAALDGRGRIAWRTALPAAQADPWSVAATTDAIYVSGTSDLGAFVARVSRDGRLAWSRTIGTAGPLVLAYALAADDQRVVIAGMFRGRVDLAPAPEVREHTSTDRDYDGFVELLDPRGRMRWIFTYGAKDCDTVRALALAPSRVYALADTTHAAALGPTLPGLAAADKTLLVALDERGALAGTWVVASTLGPTGTYPELFLADAASAPHRLVVAGTARTTVSIFGRRTAAPYLGGPFVLDIALPP